MIKYMSILLLALLFLIGCSPTGPELEGDIQYADVEGTTWVMSDSFPGATVYSKSYFTFKHDTIVCQIDKYSTTLGSTPYANRFFKGNVNYFRYWEDNDGDILLRFNWTRKEYVGGDWDRPLADYHVSSDYFLWKIENDSLHFGFIDEDDEDAWSWTLTRGIQ